MKKPNMPNGQPIGKGMPMEGKMKKPNIKDQKHTIKRLHNYTK